jgi:hypothetical protein
MRTGRPKKEINWDLVDQLLGIFCTGEECAAVLGVDYDTLKTAVNRLKKMSFSEYSEIKKGAGRASLRRRQFRMSETNPAMCIWLGKQYLGQKDTQEITGRDGQPLLPMPPVIQIMPVAPLTQPKPIQEKKPDA